MNTTKQNIEKLLKKSNYGLTPEDIESRLYTKYEGDREPPEPKEILSILGSISQSQDLYGSPPECISCGFDNFDNIINIPSRCPNCKNERINSPKFKIE